MFSQSRVEVSAGLTDVSGLAVVAYDLAYCSLSVLVLDVRQQLLLRGDRFVCNAYLPGFMKTGLASSL